MQLRIFAKPNSGFWFTLKQQVGRSFSVFVIQDILTSSQLYLTSSPHRNQHWNQHAWTQEILNLLLYVWPAYPSHTVHQTDTVSIVWNSLNFQSCEGWWWWYYPNIYEQFLFRYELYVHNVCFLCKHTLLKDVLWVTVKIRLWPEVNSTTEQ